MTLATVSLIASIIAFGLNILTLLFIFGYWKGRIDTKIGTLWDVYVTSVLTRQIQRQSPDPPFPTEWHRRAKSLSFTPPNGETVCELVCRIGVGEVQRVAMENKLSFGETLAQFILEEMKQMEVK